MAEEMDSGGNDAVDFSTAPARVISPDTVSRASKKSSQQVWREASVSPTKTLSLDCVQKVLRPPSCPDSGRATCCLMYTAGADSRPECRAAVGGQNVNLRGLSVRPTGKDTARGHTADWEGHSKRTHPDWEGHSKRTHTRLGRTQQEDTPRLGRTQQEDTPRPGRTHTDWEGQHPAGSLLLRGSRRRTWST